MTAVPAAPAARPSAYDQLTAEQRRKLYDPRLYTVRETSTWQWTITHNEVPAVFGAAYVEPGVLAITSNTGHVYQVADGHCPCPDAVRERERPEGPQRRCKHAAVALAVTNQRAAQALLTLHTAELVARQAWHAAHARFSECAASCGLTLSFDQGHAVATYGCPTCGREQHRAVDARENLAHLLTERRCLPCITKVDDPFLDVLGIPA